MPDDLELSIVTPAKKPEEPKPEPWEMKFFEYETEIELLKLLGGILEERHDEYSLDPADVFTKDVIRVVDPAHVMMFEGRSPQAKTLLLRFYNEMSPPKKLNLSYDLVVNDGAKLDAKYLLLSMKVLQLTGGCALIQAGHDFPITMKNNHFRIFISPRIEEDKDKREDCT